MMGFCGKTMFGSKQAPTISQGVPEHYYIIPVVSNGRQPSHLMKYPQRSDARLYARAFLNPRDFFFFS